MQTRITPNGDNFYAMFTVLLLLYFFKKTNETILFFELVYIFFKIGNVIISKFENLKKEILCSLSSSSAKDAKVSPKSLGTT